MKPGDLVKRKNVTFCPANWGLFMGLKTFNNGRGGVPYTCAEVMWFMKRAPNGDPVSTIQPNLLEVVSESNTD